MAELGYWIGNHPFAATVILIVFLIAVVMAITSTVKYKKVRDLLINYLQKIMD